MSAMVTCQHCARELPADPRQKGRQQYCNERGCQRARKAAWQRDKMATDAAYRERQKACQDRWRQDRPLHQYQRDYRQTHPDYVERNREQQRARNRQRLEPPVQPKPVEKIVKMDASPARAIPTGTYELRPLSLAASQKIVKMDALIVQIRAVSASTHANAP